MFAIRHFRKLTGLLIALTMFVSATQGAIVETIRIACKTDCPMHRQEKVEEPSCCHHKKAPPKKHECKCFTVRVTQHAPLVAATAQTQILFIDLAPTAASSLEVAAISQSKTIPTHCHGPPGVPTWAPDLGRAPPA